LEETQLSCGSLILSRLIDCFYECQYYTIHKSTLAIHFFYAKAAWTAWSSFHDTEFLSTSFASLAGLEIDGWSVPILWMTFFTAEAAHLNVISVCGDS
jgi:hypothetical protein